MSVQKTKDGKVDKRTKEYKEMCANLAKARAKQKKASITTTVKKKSSTSSLKRTADGTVDKRTKEGKAIAERMAKARAAQGSLKNRLKRLFR